MDKRTVEVSLQTAREWYKSNNEALKEVALQAFSEEELTRKSFRDIKTFADAYQYLYENKMCEDLLHEYKSTTCASYSETICKYRIVVAALTNNEKRNLINGDCWFPVVQFCCPEDVKNCWGKEILGYIESEGKKYAVVGGCAHDGVRSMGLGYFCSYDGMSHSIAYVSFRSVSSKEVAQYISKQFGRLLFEVHYGGVNCDWKWVD